MFSSNGTGFFFSNPAPPPAASQQNDGVGRRDENGANYSANSAMSNGVYGFNGLYDINGNTENGRMMSSTMNPDRSNMGHSNVMGNNMGSSNVQNFQNINSQLINSGMSSPPLHNVNNRNNSTNGMSNPLMNSNSCFNSGQNRIHDMGILRSSDQGVNTCGNGSSNFNPMQYGRSYPMINGNRNSGAMSNSNHMMGGSDNILNNNSFPSGYGSTMNGRKNYDRNGMSNGIMLNSSSIDMTNNNAIQNTTINTPKNDGFGSSMMQDHNDVVNNSMGNDNRYGTEVSNSNAGLFGNFSFSNSFFNPFGSFGFSSSIDAPAKSTTHVQNNAISSNTTASSINNTNVQMVRNDGFPPKSPVRSSTNNNIANDSNLYDHLPPRSNAIMNSNISTNMPNTFELNSEVPLTLNTTLNNGVTSVNSNRNTPMSPNLVNGVQHKNNNDSNYIVSGQAGIVQQTDYPRISSDSTSPGVRCGTTPEPMSFMTPPMGPTPDPQLRSPQVKNFSINSPQNQIIQESKVSSAVASDPTTTDFAGETFFSNIKTVAKQGQNELAKTSKDAKTTKSRKRTAASKEPDFSALVSQSFFRRGITSMGSALGVVANYINESFLSGIPFHIADRAMKESKETYAKWWEGGINDSNVDNNGDGFRGGRNDTDNESTEDEFGRPEKRRKLTPLRGDFRRSSLSDSLEKNYEDMGINIRKKTNEDSPNFPHHGLPLPGISDIDPSIIKPRRSKFQKRGSFKAQDSSGYDVFNNIGSMYGSDMCISGGNATDSEKVDEESKPPPDPQSKRSIPITSGMDAYDCMYGYGGDEDDSNDFKDETDSDSPASEETPNDDGAPKSNAKVSVKKNATVIRSSNTLDGTLNAIRDLFEEKNRVSEEKEVFQMISSPRAWITKTIRSELIEALQNVSGDVKDKRFLSSLEVLARFYKASGRDARVNPWSGRRESDESGYGYYGGDIGGPTSSDLLEGSWLNMSRPNYVECLGNNADGDFMYTLGRMSFDMFQPGNLICSVQSTHNTIKIVGEREELPTSVPSSLKEEVSRMCDSNGASAAKRPLLRSYDIAVSMTIEPPSTVGQPEPQGIQSPTTRMRAVMSVKGYVLPDPNTPNRLTVWFIGGKLSPARLASGDGGDTDDEDETVCEETHTGEDGYGGFGDWTALFAKGKWRKTLAERARAMAAKLLLGADVPNKMEEDGHMEYSLHRPVGGHGKVYVDVLYLDEDILIMRGHHGTIYAMSRSGVSQRYKRLRGRRTSNNE